MRKLLFSLAGLALGGYVMLMPRSSSIPVAPQGAQADQAPNTTQRPTPLPPRSGPSPYEVKAKDGAWMICAANYTGLHANHLAHQVVQQLRDRKINAFIFNFADKDRAEQQWTAHQLLRAKEDPTYRPRFTRIEGQTAVLVGGFKTMEEARAALPTVMRQDPPNVQFPNGKDASDRYMVLDRNEKTEVEKAEIVEDAKGAIVNPFHGSFVIRNPAATKKLVAKKEEADPAWKSLNSDEPFSLLKNKKEYTLVVKIYDAGGQFQSGMNAKGGKNDFISKIGLGGATKGPDALQATALQAHEVAKALRHFKIDAYVLHMRHGSLVAVGGFKTLDDPEILALKKKVGGMSLRPQGAFISNAPTQDESQDPLQLLKNPMPMRVPKL